MRGRIIRLISNQYTVLLEDGTSVLCVARGKLRLGYSPLAGDLVEVEKSDDKYTIEKIEERKNYLSRPPISNMDQALIVMSAYEPEFSAFLVDQLIFLISAANIHPVLLITKMDLADKNPKVYEEIEDYKKSGYEVYLSGLKDSKEEMEELKNLLKGKITVLCGQSGVGKSTLINKIEPSFSLDTQEISKALNRGKHTTRHVELHPVAEGYVADTPGFSKLDFGRIGKKELADFVPDFQEYLGKCRFNDCQHDREPDCAVKKAVEEKKVSAIRYQHYLTVLKTIQEREEKYD